MGKEKTAFSIFHIIIAFLIILLMVGGFGTAAESDRKEWKFGSEFEDSCLSDDEVKTSYGLMPHSFIPNKGQIADPNVKFMLTTGGSSLFFTSNEVYITSITTEGENQSCQIIKQTFPNSNLKPEIKGNDPLEGTANFLFGSDSSQWQQNLPTYGKIIYHDIYPGIDLSYFGTNGHLKREFIVNPGADPSAISFSYEGVNNIFIDENRVLHLTTDKGELLESPLVCYQVINGQKISVGAEYNIFENGTVSFLIGCYNPSYTLIIDPELVYSLHYGGTNLEAGISIAVDSNGHAYITGQTASRDFLTTPGAIKTNYNDYLGLGDAFIVKMNLDGSAPIYSTYFGGTHTECGYGIVVDRKGNAIITGETWSSDFPTTTGAFQTIKNKTIDAFVVKLNHDGSLPIFSTFLGGYDCDWGLGVTVDNDGNIFITGMTNSGNFPTTSDVVNPNYLGASDIFIVKMNENGSNVIYSTYYGGSGNEQSNSITVDPYGNAYITGSTNSVDFLTTPGVVQPNYCEDEAIGHFAEDVFVLKLNSDGSSPIYATYYGGSRRDYGQDIAIDTNGNAYITGYTTSEDFPTTIGAMDSTFSGEYGDYDSFILKLNSDGSTPLYATFYGGSSKDIGTGIVVDGSENVYITGQTYSNDLVITEDAIKPYNSGEWDIFFLKLAPDGKTLDYATYYGGDSDDYGEEIALDFSGNAFIVGTTGSSDFPTTDGAINEGAIFIVKIAMGVGPYLTPVPPACITSLHNTTYLQTSITWTWTDPADADFDHVMVYLDGVFQENVTQGIQSFTAAGLNPATEYTIGTRTVGNTGLVNATWVYHTAMTAPEPVTPVPPECITNLHNTTYQQTSITWTWTDPADADFDHVMVYLDGIFQGNVTAGEETFTASSLTPETSYTIGTRTVGNTGLVNATWVNNTATTAPEPVISVPPASVTSLHNTTYLQTSITWTWTDPADADFDHVMVYVDGVFQGNVTAGEETFLASSLTPETSYTIGTRTVGTTGLVNATWVNNTATTAPEPVIPVPPGSVTNLHNTTYQQTSITWVWTDPSSADFDHVMVYLDGVFQENVTQGIQSFTAAGLNPATEYTIGTRTVGNTGLVNATWVFHMAMTAQQHSGTSFDVELNDGWNIFSTPIVLESGYSKFTELFPVIEQEKLLVVIGWDGSQWFIPTAETVVQPLDAYFIKVKEGETAHATIVSSNSVSSLPARQIDAGINLIGFAPAYDSETQFFPEMPLNQALVSIEYVGNYTGYTIVVSPSYNQPAWSYAKGGQIYDFIPFKGYWVVMENGPDTLYGFSTTPIQV